MRPLCLAEHEAHPESPSPTHLQETLLSRNLQQYITSTSTVFQQYNSVYMQKSSQSAEFTQHSKGNHNQYGWLSTGEHAHRRRCKQINVHCFPLSIKQDKLDCNVRNGMNHVQTRTNLSSFPTAFGSRRHSQPAQHTACRIYLQHHALAE